LDKGPELFDVARGNKAREDHATARCDRDRLVLRKETYALGRTLADRDVRQALARQFPDAGHRFTQFFVGHVQVALRLLDVGVAEHQLDRTDVDAVGQKPASALVTQVMPVEVDLRELLAIDASAGFRSFRVVAVRDEQQKLPSGLEAVHLPLPRAASGRLGVSRIGCDRQPTVPVVGMLLGVP
jgi:hypothetical protein